jgi:hypothetical protein
MSSPAVTETSQAKKMPSLGVRKHPHVEGVYIYDPKHASYMLSRDEANSLGFWEFSEEDWDMIFLAEPKVSVSMLCNEMTDSRYRYDGLARAQLAALKVTKDDFGCWTCNEFSSTLAISRVQAEILGHWGQIDEEAWEWIFCGEERVEVGLICDVLTPSHCKEEKRHYERVAELAAAKLEALEPEEAEIPPMPLLTPALLRQEAVILEPEPAPKTISPEAKAWIKGVRQRLNSLPPSSDSIHTFLSRIDFIANLLQSLLESVHFVEVLDLHPSGMQFAKACLRAAANLSGDERKVEQVRADLKFYRCPFYLRRRLDASYRRIQDLVAIMRATVSPYVDKHD